MILFGLLTAGLGIHEWFLSFMLENRGRFKTLLLTLRNFLISYISPKMWDEPASVLKKLFLSGFKLVSSSAGFPDVIKLFNDKLLSQSLNSRSTTIYYVILPGVTIIVGVAFIFFINKPIIMPIISKFLARQAFVVVKEKFKDFTKASQRSFITFLKDMFKSMPDKIDNN